MTLALALLRIQDAILALIPAPPSDGPRRASSAIDPTQGFATTGAEARWIADTEAGVYDNAPCPTCGRELLLKDGHVFCRQCPAPPSNGGDDEGFERITEAEFRAIVTGQTSDGGEG